MMTVHMRIISSKPHENAWSYGIPMSVTVKVHSIIPELKPDIVEDFIEGEMCG
jgi:hypothetical protein